MLFWPKSSGCCCGGNEPCGEICVTVLTASGAPLNGATVDGAALGTCVTGMDGECCRPIHAPGTYSFPISKTGYTSNTISVTVGEEGCNTTTPVTTNTTTTLVETSPGAGLVRGCHVDGTRVPLGGVVIVVTDSLGAVVATVTSDPNGRAPYTVPAAGTYTLTGNLAPFLESTNAVTHGSAGTYLAALDMSWDDADWICCRGDTPISRTLYITTPLGSFTLAKAVAGNVGNWAICRTFDYYGDGSPAAIGYTFQCWNEAGVPGYMVTQTFCAGRINEFNPWVGEPGAACTTQSDGSTTLVNCGFGTNTANVSHKIFVPRTLRTMSPVAVTVNFPSTTSQNFLDGAYATIAVPVPGTVTVTE